jgi:hypothetical protein
MLSADLASSLRVFAVLEASAQAFPLGRTSALAAYLVKRDGPKIKEVPRAAQRKVALPR